MRVAIVSFEYAGVASGGGIGTYARNIAVMLAERGHSVEVFCGQDDDTKHSQAHQNDAGILLNPIKATRVRFSQDVVAPFLARHEAIPFDVVEGAEYGADLSVIANVLPAIPRVVKLHTASFQIDSFNNAYVSQLAKLRFVLGAVRRRQWPRPYWSRYEPEADAERRVTVSAHEIVAPSRALLDWTSRAWHLDREKTIVIPNAFRASSNLLSFPPDRPSKMITFLGKLEVRKGVLELAKAIPEILKSIPDAQFQFVGRSLPHPATGEPLDHAIMRIVGRKASDSVKFMAAVPYDQIAGILEETAIAVFPSYWENFPYVCLEAMAAGCSIVGSNAGGMAEMIQHGRSGVLVPPRSPAAIAQAVCSLLRDPQTRSGLGANARARVVQTYDPTVIAPLQEQSYARAISRARNAATESDPNVARTEDSLNRDSRLPEFSAVSAN
jgi:glycogen synthase